MDVFGAGGACREPAIWRHKLDAAQRLAIARCVILAVTASPANAAGTRSTAVSETRFDR